MLPEIRLDRLLQVVHVDLDVNEDVENFQGVISVHRDEAGVAVVDLQMQIVFQNHFRSISHGTIQPVVD